MGGASVERFSSDVPAAELAAAIERDGCAIVEQLVEPAALQNLNGEFDALIAATAPGVRNWEPEPDSTAAASGDVLDEREFEELRNASPAAVDAVLREFYGSDTVRIDGLPGKSAGFVELMCHPLLLAAADYFLLPNCQHYTLNTGQLIEIRPGETKQPLHSKNRRSTTLRYGSDN